MGKEQPATEVKFSKSQILSSANYRERRDLLSVLLHEDKKYSLKEVDQSIENFMKKKVK